MNSFLEKIYINTTDSHLINKYHNIIGFKYRGTTKLPKSS